MVFMKAHLNSIWGKQKAESRQMAGAHGETPYGFFLSSHCTRAQEEPEILGYVQEQ